MQTTALKREIFDLIEIIPDSEIKTVKKFIEFILFESKEKNKSPDVFIMNHESLPIDEEPISRESEAIIEASLEQVKRGEYYSLEDAIKMCGKS